MNPADPHKVLSYASRSTPPPVPAAIPVATSIPTPGGISPQQVNELVQARERAKKLRRATSVARFDGWTIAAFAVLTGLTGLFSLSTLLLAAGMGYCAWREFRGARELEQLHPNSLRALSKNQLVLAGCLILYALWQGWTSYHETSSLSSAGVDPQLRDMIGPIDEITKTITVSVYGLIVLVAIFAQGGTALYYHTRQKFLDAYIKLTPAWIIELQQKGVAI